MSEQDTGLEQAGGRAAASRALLGTLAVSAGVVIAVGTNIRPAAADTTDGIDANQMLKAPFQTAAIAVLALTFALVGLRLVSLRRRTLWARRHAQAKAFNPLARTSTRMLPAALAAAPNDVPGWLVTGSIDAPRRAWGASSPSPSAAPVASSAMAMVASDGRPLL